MCKQIVIIDYGMGNLGSIVNILKRIGLSLSDISVTCDVSEVSSARRIILPGVGAFDSAIEELNKNGLFEAVFKAVTVKGTPILGICLGMQLMTRFSEEGSLQGFAFFDAITRKLEKKSSDYPLPHMGWNTAIHKKIEPIVEGLVNPARFYFLHSYYVECNDRKDILMETEYGSTFCSAISRGNIIGVQFHPEKSHRFGITFIKNFVEKY